MANASQRPGRLSVAFVRGNDYSANVDFSIDVTGFNWTAELRSLNTRELVATPVVNATDAAAGKVNISVPRAVGSALAAGTYWLSVAWTAPGGVRDVIAGTCEINR